MATSLDMSLDDLIKSRSSSERGRGRGRGRARRGRGQGGSFGRGRTGGNRGGALRVNARPSSYAIAKSFNRTKDFTWQHDLFQDSLMAAGISGIESGTKLYVSNLDYGVSNEDIKELFSEIGELKRYAIHYDRNGRSSGSAEVVYVRKSDALAAVMRYNSVVLDGKPMKIEIIGTNLELPVSARMNVIGAANGRGRRTVFMTPEVGLGRGSAPVNNSSGRWSRGVSWRGRGGGRGRGRGRGRGWGRGRGRKQPVEKSAEELDKELDTYHTEAMQTS
ncbi:THO complex subunit 4D-like isoform X1 [Macadamia integrifolia]|uniref:THO complex subunit 4D-like isoform X1 n=1 Tax=Macadamia integrifolia TaxID=60698 RepID=UPI001C4F096D|nr:THO complex subunit 4D-like isoform X1 [Macadamia integrifolia]XP_042498760.1 THO complex subunit 4D-like isoform X1 [Macadamia integrifolia]XP_042498761.1 THO complex subunit 4D-like isoform X1 [Macadamia integrifolia]XP_042498762.1 THO complex subunit 4D-like isoform X1 [Macadamia integrifolia]